MIWPIWDAVEVLALIATFVGSLCSAWAIAKTRTKLQDIRLAGQNGMLRTVGMQRLWRHMLNLLAQLALLYLSFIAVQEIGSTDRLATASRITTTFVSMILAVKVMMDRWQEIVIEWGGEDRRRHRRAEDSV